VAGEDVLVAAISALRDLGVSARGDSEKKACREAIVKIADRIPPPKKCVWDD